ncbi:hypothetical protein NDU88_004714 [Pleurodeles waltl]|uniref:Uncharacterized protein n=1 Tax=Pleurodeles waltl TaxID=8319 RepID=A0AAV7MUN8_PLEWA|nr:hypothetical protein NDU88_004714 [Pleurodeles waltl]
MQGNFQCTICNAADKRHAICFVAEIGAPPASRLGDRHIVAGETTQPLHAAADNDANPMQRGFLTPCDQISHASWLAVKAIVNLHGTEVTCL